MKHPLVSVIIPTFNRARMVGEAVESVLQQQFINYELIVVDDGSTDNTREILNRYDKRIKQIKQINKGVSNARNVGAAKANGLWLAFLDSDDLWLPNKLRHQVEFVDRNPESLLCQTQEIWIRNGKRVNPKNRHLKPSGMIFEPSLNLCLVSPSAVMIRKSFFEKTGGFDETLPACEDYDLWLRITCRYPVHLIDEPMIVKRGGHEDQLSKTPKLDKYRIQSICKLLASDQLTADQQRAATRVLRKKCAVYANGCRKRGRIQEAIYYERLGKSHINPMA